MVESITFPESNW